MSAGTELVLGWPTTGSGATSDWGDGFGLRNMATRRRALGGTFALRRHSPRHRPAVAGAPGPGRLACAGRL